MILIQIQDSLLKLRAALTLVDGHVEEVDVRIQGELVHGVDCAHVVQDKEEDGSSLGTRSVALWW